GKSAKDLTIPEAAMIAGRIANPQAFHPRVNMNAAMLRRAYVLDQMHAKGFLNDAQWGVSKSEPAPKLAPVVENTGDLAPEAVEWAKATLARVASSQDVTGGFTITTSIDPKLQAAARKAVHEGLAGYDKRHGLLGP